MSSTGSNFGVAGTKQGGGAFEFTQKFEKNELSALLSSSKAGPARGSSSGARKGIMTPPSNFSN